MINQITKVRLPDGTEVALTDWSARPLYSTIDLLSGFTDSELRAFSYTSGGQVTCSTNLLAAGGTRVASLRDTNIAGAGEMDSTEEFLVYAIKVEMHQFLFDTQTGDFTTGAAGLPVPLAPNVSLLQNRIVLELEVSLKAFPQAGLGWFNQGFGPVIAVGSATARTYANNGAQTHQASDMLPIPVHIGGTEDYAVILHNPPGGAASVAGAVTFVNDAGATAAAATMQVRTYLCGLQKRATA